MNAAPSEFIATAHQPDRWSRTRWLTLIALVFAAHVALIFIFGARKPVVPRAVKNVSQLQMADEKNELLALTDPTLFALPRPENLSSAEILKLAGVSPPALWLPLPDETLGVTFSAAIPPNPIAPAGFNFKPAPKLNLPALSFSPAFPQKSTWKIIGELAERKLLSPPELPSLPDDGLLQPTILQALVDADGNVVSSVVLRSSGLDAADQRALEISRAAHFEPAKSMSLGEIIFNWRTVPPPATNSPAISP